MLAAETAFEAMHEERFFARTARELQSSAWTKLDQGRVVEGSQLPSGHSRTDSFAGMFHAGLQQITGGRGLHARYAGARRAQERMKHARPIFPQTAATAPACSARRTVMASSHSTSSPTSITPARSTKKTSRRIWSSTIPNICNTRCVTEFGNPCQNFCPANVYEMEDAADVPERQADPSEPFQLCPLQDLRHHGPVRDHHLGSARGRRRAEL